MRTGKYLQHPTNVRYQMKKDMHRVSVMAFCSNSASYLDAVSVAANVRPSGPGVLEKICLSSWYLTLPPVLNPKTVSSTCTEAKP